MKKSLMLPATLLLLGAPVFGGSATAQPRKQSDAKLIASAMAAGPKSIAQGAAIVAMEANGDMRTLRQGKNGFTCIPEDPASPGADPMCLDANGMEWLHAWMNKTAPPDKVGIVFMLVTGSDASNTDPFATEPAAGEEWVNSGPHLMLLLPGDLDQSVFSTDHASGEPFIMWAGTPYEHVMMPVADGEMGEIAQATPSP